jgi:hypothetical protein
MRRLALLLILCTLPACAAVRPPSQPVPVAPALSPQRFQQLMSAIAVRDRGLTSLSTAAVMEYHAGNQHLKAREQVVVMRPEQLRVEASSPFGIALIVAVDGSRLQIYDPGKNVLMHGAATADALDRFAQIPMEPKAAVDLLMAISPDSDDLASRGQATIGQGGAIVINYPAPDGGHREARFAGDNLVGMRESDGAGQIRYEVRYADYHDIGALMFPYSIDADFPAAGSSLKLTFKRPIVNAPLAPAMFTLTPGPTTKEIDLDQPPPTFATPRS